NSGKGEEAMAAFQKSAAADPANAEPYFYMGTILVGENKVPDAVASLEKYLSMNPTNAQNVATAQGLLQALKPKEWSRTAWPRSGSAWTERRRGAGAWRTRS